MAIKQIVPILVTLQGDGSSTTFTYALGNIYQGGTGGSIPFGTAGVVPSAVSVNNPPVAVTSSTVDANGNITITFTTAPANGTAYTLEVDLIYNSGAATSSSSVQATNVNVTGGTITATESFTGAPGSSLPSNAAYIGGKNAGNLVGISVDSSGNVNANIVTALPAGSAVIGAVTQSGTWNVGTVTTVSAVTNITNAVTVAQATAASLNATVIGTGTFAVQAAQSGSWTTRVVGNTGAVLDTPIAPTTAAANALQVAGVYNSGGVTLTTGQAAAVQVDASGFLKVNVAAGSSGNAAASATGSAVPASAGYTGLNVAGNLRGWTGVNPSGSVYAGQIDLSSIAGATTSTAASGVLKVGIVGNAGAAFDAATGAAAPANALQIGGTDGTDIRAISTTIKGTQGAYAVAVQELKDSGRTYVVFPLDAATLVTSEALASVNVNKGGTLQGAATTYTVTTGKTLRIQSISASVQGTNSTVQYVKVRVRSGASVTASSPIVINLFVSNTGSTNAIGFAEQDVPDGLEIAGGQQVGISQLGGTANGTVSVTVIGYEY